MIGAQGYARSACAQYSRIDVAFYLIEKLIFRLPGIASPPNPPMSACGQSEGARAEHAQDTRRQGLLGILAL